VKFIFREVWNFFNFFFSGVKLNTNFSTTGYSLSGRTSGAWKTLDVSTGTLALHPYPNQLLATVYCQHLPFIRESHCPEVQGSQRFRCSQGGEMHSPPSSLLHWGLESELCPWEAVIVPLGPRYEPFLLWLFLR
jgi:hypothetical protein